MVSCAVASCKHSSAKSTKCANGITFHRFPQDEQRRQVWQTAVNREAEWVATDSSTVCSAHFEQGAFILTESGLRRLTAEAVPTINISPTEKMEPTISSQEQTDNTEEDSEIVVELKKKVRRLSSLAKGRKKQISRMWNTNQDMVKKLVRMRAVLKHLVQNTSYNRR